MVMGSSPLARGLLRVVRGPDDEVGIIPARAGFTPRCGALNGREWDHPRSRGVYMTRAVVPAASHGSSPLARGLRQQVLPRPWRGGIIPARAGFTVQRS